MYKFSEKSKSVLNTLHPLLKLILNDAINVVDISLIEGLRSHERQTMLYAQGKSKVMWPQSKHNRTLDKQFETIEFDISDAVDIMPYPTGYEDKEQIAFTIGVIVGIASKIGVEIKIGADWNGDGELNNKPNDFYDPLHIELIH